MLNAGTGEKQFTVDREVIMCECVVTAQKQTKLNAGTSLDVKLGNCFEEYTLFRELIFFLSRSGALPRDFATKKIFQFI